MNPYLIPTLLPANPGLKRKPTQNLLENTTIPENDLKVSHISTHTGTPHKLTKLSQGPSCQIKLAQVTNELGKLIEDDIALFKRHGWQVWLIYTTTGINLLP